MKGKRWAAAAVGAVAALTLAPVPAQAQWNELSSGRVGFWTLSYGDPWEDGRFGGYRTPDYGGAWGYILPSWLDYPKSIWNRSDRSMWVYNNPSCRSDGGRWVRQVSPGQRVESTSGTNWNSIQAFSYLAPTSSRRSCG